MLKVWLQEVRTLLFLNVSHLFYNVMSIEYIMMDVKLFYFHLVFTHCIKQLLFEFDDKTFPFLAMGPDFPFSILWPFSEIEVSSSIIM